MCGMAHYTRERAHVHVCVCLGVRAHACVRECARVYGCACECVGARARREGGAEHVAVAQCASLVALKLGCLSFLNALLTAEEVRVATAARAQRSQLDRLCSSG